jgi:hypothetical protein
LVHTLAIIGGNNLAIQFDYAIIGEGMEMKRMATRYDYDDVFVDVTEPSCHQVDVVIG